MAIFRKIHTSFWSDSFIQDLEKDQKLFYLYLLTNERTRQCGVYEITKKQISYDLGYTMDRVSILLEYFIKVGKIKYNSTTKELAIGNWLKYNNSTSPKVKSCIDKEFGYCKDTVLIEYVKSMDTLSQEEEEQEEEKEEYLLPKILFNYKKCSDKELVEELSKFKETYSKDILNSFYRYWSEKNDKGKMKMAMENTFEVDKRLITWSTNDKKFNKVENKIDEKKIIW